MIVTTDNGTKLKSLDFSFAGAGNTIIIIHSSVKIGIQLHSLGIHICNLQSAAYFSIKVAYRKKNTDLGEQVHSLTS